MKNEEQKEEFANIDETIKFISSTDSKKYTLDNLISTPKIDRREIIIPNSFEKDRRDAIIPNSFRKDNSEILL